MGNAKSSSETTPRPKYDDDDDDESIRRLALHEQAKKETDKGKSSTQFSLIVKVGAVGVGVVAGGVIGGLLALVALRLAASLRSPKLKAHDSCFTNYHLHHENIRRWSLHQRTKKEIEGESSSQFPSVLKLSSSRLPELEAHVKRNEYSYERQIKIMSYNVWFCGVEVEKRMEAIDNLVKQYSPDIIFFQEVTPNIYKLFESSTWWRLYQYNPPVPSADQRKSFCMLLSKLSVEMFTSIPFSNSMEKELCVGEINVGLYHTLIVATSHLKRQTVQMTNSLQRVSQAKEALLYLQKFPNVIFGGDMNWDEDEDGVFPLQGGWTDAWAELRGGEPGWTFDTKSNKMLKGHMPLQKRLDRFICKLGEDFRMMKIEMIGKEAIPGLTYCNEKEMLLPVFPSDHYGLILTISSNV